MSAERRASVESIRLENAPEPFSVDARASLPGPRDLDVPAIRSLTVPVPSGRSGVRSIVPLAAER
jgi:hypothetical protein